MSEPQSVASLRKHLLDAERQLVMAQKELSKVVRKESRLRDVWKIAAAAAATLAIFDAEMFKLSQDCVPAH